MQQPDLYIPAQPGHKRRLLYDLYEVYQRWVELFPLACKNGCAACCTQSVFMSSLEGELILDCLMKEGRDSWLAEELARNASGNSGMRATTNQYTRACLEQQEIGEAEPDGWNFTPCVFLDEDSCSIYDVRPFGCRSFISLEQCTGISGAEIAPIHLTVGTVFTQINEHLCSDGGYWGNMTDILAYLMAGDTSAAAESLQPAQPIPGFLLEPREVKVVNDLLKQLHDHGPEKQTFGDLIDNFMPI
ncbi:MAG: YkgJ family cysteine cluster protein [Desulfobulbales bacterium]|nr:YkgJ family cysteine cluster protein [Desulfobulbales bacterium]